MMMSTRIGVFVTSAAITLTLALAMQSVALTQSVDPELAKAVAARDAARSSRNFDQWSGLTMDDYVLIEEAGVLRTKSEQLAQMKAGPPSAQPPSKRDYTYHMYGTTAILTLVVAGADGPRRETHVWIKQGGQWMVAAVQMTPVQKR